MFQVLQLADSFGESKTEDILVYRHPTHLTMDGDVGESLTDPVQQGEEVEEDNERQERERESVVLFDEAPKPGYLW